MSTVAEPIPQRSDVAKIVRLAALRRIAHDGLMIAKMERQIRRAEQYERLAITGDTSELSKPQDDEDEMAVSIGNEVHEHHIHYHGDAKPPAPAETTTTTEEGKPATTTEATETTTTEVTKTEEEKPAATTTEPAQKKTKFWPLIIGAALLGMGTGAGIGYIASDATTTGPTEVVDTDTDTIVEMDFPNQ